MRETALATLTERYAFCDPASGKTALKHAKARSAIVILAVDDLARLFVLHAWAARCPTDRLIDQILALAEQYLQVEPDEEDKFTMEKLKSTLQQYLAKDQADSEKLLGGGALSRTLRKI